MITRQAIIGSRGEDIATQWLRERGFYIVERNWRAGRYEIDIIAEHYDTLHFVEVKTRKADSLLSPYASIDAAKRRSIRRSSAMYRATHHIRLKVQYDMIAVIIHPDDHLEIEYVENMM